MSLQDEMSVAFDGVVANDWYKPTMMDEDQPSLLELDNDSVFSSKSDQAYSPGAVLTPPVCHNNHSHLFCILFISSFFLSS